MNKPVGGRGKKAPYETQVIRVPVPIVPQVEKFIESYRVSVISDEEDSLEDKSNAFSEVAVLTYSDALQRAKEILKSKKSAADSLAKLLQLLYGGEISKEDLR